MPLLSVEIPEDNGIIGIAIVVHAEFLRPALQLVGMLEGGRARHGDARQVALHIGDEYRNALCGKAFGQPLQGDGLAGTGGARDQAVTVGAGKVEILLLAVFGEAEENLTHLWVVSGPECSLVCGKGQAVRSSSRLVGVMV